MSILIWFVVDVVLSSLVARKGGIAIVIFYCLGGNPGSWVSNWGGIPFVRLSQRYPRCQGCGRKDRSVWEKEDGEIHRGKEEDGK